MNVEYRVVVRTVHGTRHRWPIKAGPEKAREVAEVYRTCTTPFFAGCEAWIESRVLPKWERVAESEEAVA